MPAFDVVSEFERHELQNAVDQANRELTNRFDFRGVDAAYELQEKQVILSAEQDFQLEQMFMTLSTALVKRKVDLFTLGEPTDQKSGKLVRRIYPLNEGVDQPSAKSIVKKIKDSKIKVQAAIQGDQVRVTGKKRDDLQQVMQLLREDEQLKLPLQFTNFRD